MCEPVTMAVIAVASQGADYAQQAVLAHAQKKVAARNREGAMEAARLSYGQIGEAEQAEILRARSAVTGVRRDAEVARGGVTVGAAEGNVTGVSIQELYDDFERQEGDLVEAILLQERIARRGLEGERQGARNSLNSRLLSSADPAGPNPLTAAANAAVSGYSSYQTFELADNQLKTAAAGE